MTDQILSSIEATVKDIQAITNALVSQSTPAAEPCHDDQFPEIKIHPDADIDPIGTDAKQIEEQMQRVDNDINGNPRYVLHFLAFDNDYATAKEIAHSLGWSVYRAKSHSGCFVGQSYSTAAEAHFIAKARARLAGGEA